MPSESAHFSVSFSRSCQYFRLFSIRPSFHSPSTFYEFLVSTILLSLLSSLYSTLLVFCLNVRSFCTLFSMLHIITSFTVQESASITLAAPQAAKLLHSREKATLSQAADIKIPGRSSRESSIHNRTGTPRCSVPSTFQF